MIRYPNSKIKYSQIRGLPAGVFGEGYVLSVAIHDVGRHYKGEVYLVTKRPTESLEVVKFVCDGTDVDTDLVTINLDYVLSDADWHTDQKLFSMIAERAVSLNAPHIENIDPIFRECSNVPLLGCWLRGHFQSQIQAIAEQTESETLASQLAMIIRLPMIIRQSSQ